MFLFQVVLLAMFIVCVPVAADAFGPGFTGYSAAMIYGRGAPAPVVPVSYGGLTLNPANLNQLILGGNSRGSGAAFYAVNMTRDVNGHLTGAVSGAVPFAAAPKLDGGAVFGPAFAPGEVLFYTIHSGSGGADVGMVRWGSASPAKTVSLGVDSPGSFGFVPPGWFNFMEPKLLTSTGRFYSLAVEPDELGTYRIVIPQLRATLPGAPLGGFVYVKGGSPGFPNDSILVAETASGTIAAYNVIGTGDPIPSTRRVFFSGPPFARPLGMFVDPATQDLLVSTANNSSSAVYRISGFLPPQPLLLTGCGNLTTGRYFLDRNISAPVNAGPCIRIEATSRVELDCNGHTVRGDTSILVRNASEVAIRNCNLMLNPLRAVSTGYTLDAADSRALLLTGNTFGSLTEPDGYQVRLYKTHNSDIVNNTINAEFFQLYSVANFIRYNRASCPLWTSNSPPFRACDAVFTVSHGSVGFDSNTVDGRAGLSDELRGAFVGILLEMSGSLTVTNNTFDRLIHAAIETRAQIGNSFFSSNRVTRTANAGIYAYAHTRWTDNVVSNNVVDGARRLFDIGREGGIRPPGWDGLEGFEDSSAAFENNVFSGNRLINAAGPFDTGYIAIANKSYWLEGGSLGPGRPLAEWEISLKNNLFRQNDFGHAYDAPFFGSPVTPGIIIDGGGNICKAPGPGYPLACH